jgi:hypothetical protein
MVEKQRPRSGSKFTLKPQIAADLSVLPLLGYKAPPPLIGVKTMKSDVSMLRARNYAKAYKTLSVKDWNSLVVFGIQQFSNPLKYLTTRDSESEKERILRLGRYLAVHISISPALCYCLPRTVDYRYSEPLPCYRSTIERAPTRCRYYLSYSKTKTKPNYRVVTVPKPAGFRSVPSPARNARRDLLPSRPPLLHSFSVTVLYRLCRRTDGARKTQ